MFALRGVAVSLTFFVLTYCFLSALIALVWRACSASLVPMFCPVQARGPSTQLGAGSAPPPHEPHNWAGWLFALRILPLMAAVVVTFVFVLPSFQLLEPRSMDTGEGIGAMPLGLGVCALLLIGCGCIRVIGAQITTARVVARWLEGSHPLDVDVPNHVSDQPVTFCSRNNSPPLTLVGLRKPRVLVSSSTLAALSSDELQMALKHELAHMRYRDNLKKLIIRFCPFPGMVQLESAWCQIAELAADDASISKLEDAVDLAAALVKLSRLLPVEAAPVCTVGFVTGSISARVARLLAWDEAGLTQQAPVRLRSWHLVPPAIVALVCIIATYGSTLALTHEATEWLVR